MAKLRRILIFAIFVQIHPQITSRTTIDLNFFQSRNPPDVNSSLTVTTAIPSIPQRIHASLNNVLRIPLPIWGTSTSSRGTIFIPTLPLKPVAQTPTGGAQQNHAVGASGASQAAPTNFLPLPEGIQAIHSTIAQLSTLTHWPFAYVTTTRPAAPSTGNATSGQIEKTTAAPAITVQTATTTTVAPTIPPNTTPLPSTAVKVTQPPPPLPTFLAPPSPIFPQQIIPQLPPRPPLQSIPNRLQNRLQSTLGSYIRLPNLSQIGQPPRSMITEPPWVTELLGPTLEPPTTRAPTLGERVHNTLNNVLLFVPATLLNIWYQNFGHAHVDRIIQRLQVPTPKPGSTDPVFATISQNNALANFTGSESGELPVIAAFLNANGTLMPTVVHPVVNITKNTIEYQLRSENNETTVLWTGSLSNDIFFGNRTALGQEEEDDEDEQIKIGALTLRL
ncbi:hypothetical protein Ocin01_10205 [Orchesella cincta]|uniref:Uncharacterized protein n=1 Tax=Orchesella cincta TaxID=48709 RepID=A0A1D2MTS7_ORCCI|nr:hypothetical protein Ocin01_10205 [Orchesella cincta]